MSHQLRTQVNIAPAPKLSFIAAQGMSLQRERACGGSPELLKAEKNLWAPAIPVMGATTDKEAVQKVKSALTDIMAAAYSPACQAYYPKQESRAYDHGAPAYQQLVEEIQARAEREGG